MLEYDVRVKRIVQTETVDSYGDKKNVTRISLQRKEGDFKIQILIQCPSSQLWDFLQGLDLVLDDIITIELSKKQTKLGDFEDGDRGPKAEHL